MIHSMTLNPQSLNITERRWRMDPNIVYFDRKHAPLALISILVIVVLLIPYTFTLLFGYKLQKYSTRRGFRWFNCLKPLLDAYYAPYNKNTRYWTGFLLLVRFILFIVLIYPTENNLILIFMAILFAIVLAIGWLSSRIYSKFYVELIETTFILNLCGLGIVSFYFKRDQLIITSIFVGIAFVQFIGILLFHIITSIKNATKMNSQKCCLPGISKSLTESKFFKKSENNKKEKESNTTITMITIREPLLEDNAFP